jgi:amino acid transporter
LVTVINVLGVKYGAIFSDLFTVPKLLGIAAVVIISMMLRGATEPLAIL